MQNSCAAPSHFGHTELSSLKGARAFCAEFQRSMHQCLQHGFSVEECFGLIWEETLETIPLDEEDHPSVYGQLISWARGLCPGTTVSHWA